MPAPLKGRAISRGPLTYNTVHLRLKRLFGPAKHHICYDCGQPAHHWAYTGGAENEVLCEGLPYDPVTYEDTYEPKCRSCHRKHDMPLEKRLKHSRMMNSKITDEQRVKNGRQGRSIQLGRPL